MFRFEVQMLGFVAKGVDAMVGLNKSTHNSLKLLYVLQYVLAPVSNKLSFWSKAQPEIQTQNAVQGGDPSYMTILTNPRTIIYRP